MTYDAYDQSTQDGDPIHLYLFVRSGVSYRFTDVNYDVTAMSETWTSSGTEGADINQSDDITRESLQLKFPRDNSFAQSFQSDLLESITSVTIFRGYEGDPDAEFITYWKGRVVGSGIKLNTITISCEPIFTSLRRPGLGARYQRTCRHALYGSGCTVDKDSFKQDAECTGASGNTITVPDAAALAAGYLTGGMIKTSDDVYRFITKHDGETLTLIRPVASLLEAVTSSIGTLTISLYPGCDHTRSICESRFDNLDNYGGFPWIPTKNPFSGSSIL